MTGPEMIAKCQRLKDIFQAPFYDPEDYYEFINMVISELVNSYFPKRGEGSLSYEDNQRLTDDLNPLLKTIKPVIITTGLNAIHPDMTAYFVLPDDYRFYWGCSPRYNGVGVKKVIVTNFETLESMGDDPFGIPDNVNNFYICWHSGKVMIYAGSPPTEFYLHYIKNPDIVSDSVPCNLPIHLHQLITTLAVRVSMLPLNELGHLQISQMLSQMMSKDANA